MDTAESGLLTPGLLSQLRGSEHLDPFIGRRDLLSSQSSKMKPETRSNHLSLIKTPQVPGEAGVGSHRQPVSFLPRRMDRASSKIKHAGCTHGAAGWGPILQGHRLGKMISDVANKKSKVQETNIYQPLAKCVHPCYAFGTTWCQIVAGSPCQEPGEVKRGLQKTAKICL